MRRTTLLKITVIITSFSLFYSCGGDDADVIIPTDIIQKENNEMDSIVESEEDFLNEAEEMLKIRIAIAYINDYVGGDNYYKDWVPQNVYSSPNLKNELKRMIDAASDDPYGLGYDPVVNGQDSASEYVFKAYTPEGYIIAEGKDFPAFKVIIKVSKIDGSWLIDGIGDINISSEVEF